MLLQQACTIASDYIASLGYRYLFNRIDRHLQEQIWDDKALVAISCDKEAKNSMVFITNDVYWLTYNSATSLTKGMMHGVQAGIGAYTMYNALKAGTIKPKQLMAPLAMSLLQQLIVSVVTYYTVATEKKGRKIAVNYRTEQTDAVENAIDVSVSGATREIHEGIESQKAELEHINKRLDKFHFFQNAYGNLSNSLMKMVSFISFGKAIYKGQMTHDQRMTIDIAASKVVGFLTYGNMSASDIESAKLSLGNILHVLKIAKEAQTAPVSHRKFEGKNLVLNKYQMQFFPGLKDEYILTFKDIVVKPGEICLVKGQSGCGKSTLVSQIFGLQRKQFFNTFSKMTLPDGCDEKRNLAFVSQNDFAPTGWTLRDILLMGVPKDARPSDDRIIKLLNDFKLDGLENRLDKVIDFKQSTVSGGQKKRLKLINAILKDPKVLIMDEAFAGLDDDTSSLAKRLIKRELPNAIILSICHESEAGDGFHTCAMEFRKDDAGKVPSQDITLTRASGIRRAASSPDLASLAR